MPDEFVFGHIGDDDGFVDVIFVHGLGGDAKETWSSPNAADLADAFWPSWLKADIPGLALYSLGYPASWFVQWAQKELDLYERAKQVLEHLAGSGIGNRPLVFICHSLGGLLVKQLLRTAFESQDESWKAIGKSCKAIFFVATPHSGSSLAKVFTKYLGKISSPHMIALVEGSPELVALNEACRQNCLANGIAVFSYYEKHHTKPVGLVVDIHSADPGIGANLPVPIEADHIEICRPKDRYATLYLGVSNRLKGILNVSMSVGSHSADKLPFEEDGLADLSETDRRDLHTKLIESNREHEFSIANEAQNRFARQYAATGLRDEFRKINDDLLAEVKQLFITFVYHAKICAGASNEEIDLAVWEKVINPTVAKYTALRASAQTVQNAIYFLTEKCHIRWDMP